MQRLRPLLSTRTVGALLGITLILNLFDAVLTLYAVLVGGAIEVNPLMAELLARGPLHFMVAKLLLVSLGILMLWRLRGRLLAHIGSVCAFGVYSLLLFHHIQGLSQMLH